MEPKTQVDAKKETLGADDAFKLLDKVNQLYVAKGQKLVHIDLKKDRPGDDELKKLILGPTGNLRAPTLRKGKTLLVGFNSDAYEEVLV